MALNNVPQAGQNLQETRDDIRNNFSTIDTAFSVNHVPYNSPSDQGKHQFVTFPQIASGSVPAAGAQELIVSNQTNADTGRTELYLKRNAGTPVPITAGVDTGWSYLPSGLLMKWGSVPQFTGSTTINLNANGPAFTTGPFSIQLTGNTATGNTQGADMRNNASATTTASLAIVANPTGSTMAGRYFVIGS